MLMPISAIELPKLSDQHITLVFLATKDKEQLEHWHGDDDDRRATRHFFLQAPFATTTNEKGETKFD